MRQRVEALFHPAYVLAGIPEDIILGADENDVSPDALDFDLLLFLQRMQALGLIEHRS